MGKTIATAVAAAAFLAFSLPAAAECLGHGKMQSVQAPTTTQTADETKTSKPVQPRS